MDFRYEDYFELKPSHRLRDADLRRADRRPDAVQPRGQHRGRVEGVQPILDAVAKGGDKIHTYPAGSDGPAAASAAVAGRTALAQADLMRDQARRLRRRRDDGDAREGLDPATIAAAHRLRDAGIHLALVSSRPPRGMAFLTMELGLTGPLGGFNGATILAPDGAVIEDRFVRRAVRTSLAMFAERGIDAWLFADNQWLIKDLDGDYVPKERMTVRFEPTVVDDFEPFIARCGKVVGASAKFDELAAVRDGAAGVARRLRQRAPVAAILSGRDQPVGRQGHRCPGVGQVVWHRHRRRLRHRRPVATTCRCSASPGTASPWATRPRPSPPKQATHCSNEQDGWAAAIDRFVLPGLGTRMARPRPTRSPSSSPMWTARW